MKREEIYAIYDAIITAECCGDYATASAFSKKLSSK